MTPGHGTQQGTVLATKERKRRSAEQQFTMSDDLLHITNELQHCFSMFAMAQLFFRQQTKRHNDQTAAGIRGQRRINAEEKPVCYGYEENAQANGCQHEDVI